MFAGGQGLPGKPLAKLCETLEIFWDKAIHHPFQTVWSQPLSESDCELQIEDRPASVPRLGRPTLWSWLPAAHFLPGPSVCRQARGGRPSDFGFIFRKRQFELDGLYVLDLHI